MFKTLIVVCAFGASSLALADHHKGMMKEPTKEQRAQMVEMHTKMAECLKTDKPMADCHKEMAASCPMAKEGNCPMMGMHMGDHMGKKMGKKMKGKEKATE